MSVNPRVSSRSCSGPWSACSLMHYFTVGSKNLHSYVAVSKAMCCSLPSTLAQFGTNSP